MSPKRRRPPNPPPASWQVSLSLPAEAADRMADALAALGGAVTMLPENAQSLPPVGWEAASAAPVFTGPVHLLAHFDAEPDRAVLDDAARGALGDGPAPAIAIDPVPPTDWVAAVRRASPPVTAGRFFVHGGHFKGAVPPDRTAIRLDAGQAFGTGRHATTAGCLAAIDRLRGQGFRVRRALDLGTGSGLLAIAIAKAWAAPARVTASDNDAVAAAVAADNARRNRVAARIDCVVAEGYAAPAIADAAPFDLITANLFARALAALAGDLARHLAPGGRAVLSGLLAEQAQDVIAAHAAHGLVVIGRIARRAGEEVWPTLVIGRPPAQPAARRARISRNRSS